MDRAFPVTGDRRRRGYRAPAAAGMIVRSPRPRGSARPTAGSP
jgi:hypothetical protein